MPLTGLTVDEGPHNSDGLLLHAWDGTEKVTAFIGRGVMEDWVDPKQADGGRQISSAINTMRLASATCRQSSGSLPPNIGGVRRSTPGIRSSMSCYLTSQKAARCST